jgi:Leucine-rich repeat (LRR) protein
MLNSIQRLNSFIVKNESHISLEPDEKRDALLVPRHPINRENVNKWLESHNRTDTIDYMIAKTIANNIMNISYADIKNRFNHLVNELNIIYLNSNTALYLYIPTDISKSNFIFTMFFYNLCLDKEIVFNGVTDNYMSLTQGINNIIVLVDDVSYSGSQISNHIGELSNICEGFTFFLAIPYISMNAKKLIKDRLKLDDEVIFPSTSIEFKSIKQYMSDTEKLDIKNYKRVWDNSIVLKPREEVIDDEDDEDDDEDDEDDIDFNDPNLVIPESLELNAIEIGPVTGELKFDTSPPPPPPQSRDSDEEYCSKQREFELFHTEEDINIRLQIVERLEMIAKHIVYIDFKLPDSISIPQTTFAYGYKVGDSMLKQYSDPSEVLCFIGGCEETFRNNPFYPKKTFDLNKIEIYGGVCPQSFYKKLKWDLDDDDTFDPITRDRFIDGIRMQNKSQNIDTIQSVITDGVSIPDLPTFSLFPILQSLNLHSLMVSDLSRLRGLPNLENLIIRSSYITDLNMDTFPRLTKLYLSYNKLVKLTNLSNNRTIRMLHLSNNSLSDISEISALTNLTQLQLNDNQIVSVSPLSGLTQLTELDLSHNRIIGTPPFSELVNLERLLLSHNQIDSILSMRNLTNLQHLDLSHNKLVGSPLFSSLVNLKRLFLTNNRIQHIESLHTLIKLKDLDLSYNRLSGPFPINTLVNLVTLNLNSNHFDSVVMLKGYKNLIELDIGHNHVTDISPIRSLFNLDTLILSNNPIRNMDTISKLIDLIQDNSGLVET